MKKNANLFLAILGNLIEEKIITIPNSNEPTEFIADMLKQHHKELLDDNLLKKIDN